MINNGGKILRPCSFILSYSRPLQQGKLRHRNEMTTGQPDPAGDKYRAGARLSHGSLTWPVLQRNGLKGTSCPLCTPHNSPSEKHSVLHCRSLSPNHSPSINYALLRYLLRQIVRACFLPAGIPLSY